MRQAPDSPSDPDELRVRGGFLEPIASNELPLHAVAAWRAAREARAVETFTHPAILHPEGADFWWGEAPDLPGCLTGDSFDECGMMIADAMEGWIYVTRIHNQPYSPPSRISAIDGEGDPVVLVTGYLTDEDLADLARDQELAAKRDAGESM